MAALGSGQQVDLAVQRRNQAVDTLALKDRVELRALRRQLADGAVEVYIGDFPGTRVLAHPIIEGGRIAVCFDDLGLHDDFGAGKAARR